VEVREEVRNIISTPILDGCQTTHQRAAFVERELNFIVLSLPLFPSSSPLLFPSFPLSFPKNNQSLVFQQPQAAFLGNRIQNLANGQLDFERREGYYFPFLELIKRMLRNPSILSYVANPNFGEGEVLRDSQDGSNTRNHPLVQAYRDCLRIRLYFDEVELTNPHGSYSTKVGVFHFQLENLPKEERSKLHIIQLLALAHAEDIKEFGVENLLNDFLQTMREFAQGKKKGERREKREGEKERRDNREQRTEKRKEKREKMFFASELFFLVGITIQLTADIEHIFFAAVIGCSGDNPALAYLGSYKESAAFAWCNCRVCFGNQETIQQHVLFLFPVFFFSFLFFFFFFLFFFSFFLFLFSFFFFLFSFFLFPCCPESGNGLPL